MVVPRLPTADSALHVSMDGGKNFLAHHPAMRVLVAIFLQYLLLPIFSDGRGSGSEVKALRFEVYV